MTPLQNPQNLQAHHKFFFACHTEPLAKYPRIQSASLRFYKAYLKFYGFFATLKMTNTPKPPQNITQITIFPQNLPKNFRQKQKIPFVQQLHIIIYAKISPKTKFFPNSLKNTNSQKFKQSPKFCHTERSEVSTNSKCEFALLYKAYLKFYGFFATLKMTKSPKISAPQTKIPPNFFQTPKKISPKISAP